MKKAARGTASIIRIRVKTFGDIDLPQDNSTKWKQILQKLNSSKEKLNLLAKQHWHEHHRNEQNLHSDLSSNQNQDELLNSELLFYTCFNTSDGEYEDLFAELSDNEFYYHQSVCPKVGLDFDVRNDDIYSL